MYTGNQLPSPLALRAKVAVRIIPSGMNSRKIALVVDSMYGGGAEKVALTLRRALEGCGHEAHVIALESTSHYDAGAERQLHFLRTSPKSAGGGRAYAKQALELRELLTSLERADGRPFDLVVANLIHSQHVVARAGLSNDWYCVHASISATLGHTLRRNPLQYWRQRRQQLILNGKRVIAVSLGLERELKESRWLKPASVRTIYNPFEFETLRRLAASTGEPLPTGPYLLHVGRAANQKRIDILLEALRRSENTLPLVMLTNHPDKVARLAKKFGVAERVRPVAFRQNPYPWMARAELVILSSDYEGFPLVLIEALAVGTPVVSTDCPHGPAEILTGALARWLVPVGDAGALGKKIDEALAASIRPQSAPILAQLDAPLIAAQYAALAI
jgi:glycosyltransferase involved in cell wall biosynthesis